MKQWIKMENPQGEEVYIHGIKEPYTPWDHIKAWLCILGCVYVLYRIVRLVWGI